MRAPFVTSLALLTLAACGGNGSTNPPPPPVNRVVSLTRADSSILQFTGKRVALSKLFRATDANGATISDARLTCVTPAGFTLTGDSLVAPTSETRGKLRCSATTIAAVAGLASSAQADAPADSMTVTAGIDLRLYTWRAVWKCAGDPYASYEPNGVVIGHVDSLAMDGRVLSVAYAGDAGYVSNYRGDGVAQFTKWHGTETLYRGGAVVYADTITVGLSQSVQAQAVDTLFWSNPGKPGPFKAAPRTADQTHRVYVGGDWCASGEAMLAPLTLEEVLP